MKRERNRKRESKREKERGVDGVPPRGGARHSRCRPGSGCSAWHSGFEVQGLGLRLEVVAFGVQG